MPAPFEPAPLPPSVLGRRRSPAGWLAVRLVLVVALLAGRLFGDLLLVHRYP